MADTNNSYIGIFFDINGTSIHLNATLSQSGSMENNFGKLAIVERLTVFLTFIVSIIGIIGNAGTIIVLNQQTMRQWRSSVLLTALAAVDLLYLLIIFLSIIDALTNQAVGLHRSLLLCQTTVYITHVCSFLSATFTLSFTLQRFVAVHFPLHAHLIISYRASIINILLLLFISSTFYSFSFYVTNISQGQCREDESYPVLFPLLIVDICFTFIIPFIFILLFNIAIVIKLNSRIDLNNRFAESVATSIYTQQSKQSRTERRKFYQINTYRTSNDYMELKCGTQRFSNQTTKGNSESRNSDIGYVPKLSYPRLMSGRLSYECVSPLGTVTKHQQAISQRTTKMLVICSTTFLIFNSPYSAVLFYSIISKHVLTRVLDILRHFYFMSFGLNFFLYSLCGHRFRQEVIILLKSIFRRCCTDLLRHHCSSLYKLPPQTNDSRATTRSGV